MAMEMALLNHPYHRRRVGLGGVPPMHMYPNAHNLYGPNMMHPPMVHPPMMQPPMLNPLDPMGVGIGPPNLGAMHPMAMGMDMGMNTPPLRPNIGMYSGGLRPRRGFYHHDMYPHGHGYGGGRRYVDPYDLFDDFFDDELDLYLDDYDDIDDPLMLWLRMQRGGGGRRGGRRGRYGRGRLDYYL